MSHSEITAVSDHDTTPPQPNSSATTFTKWPPSQRTRDTVINRLIEILTTPSPISKRYGTFSSDKAAVVARQIEEEALVAAGAVAAENPKDGVEILQAYSEEISKRMLEAAKPRAPPASATGNSGGAVHGAVFPFAGLGSGWF